MGQRWIEVNDSMQWGYRYLLSAPEGLTDPGRLVLTSDLASCPSPISAPLNVPMGFRTNRFLSDIFASCWMMAENTASRKAIPLLSRFLTR